MPIKDYKFVSPGVQVKEIDRSVLAPTTTEIGPVIVGKFSKGPAFIPTIIQSKKELEDVFGAKITGEESVGDVWREGNSKLAPSYASIAAEAHLDADVSAITVVRMLGAQHSEATVDGKAGWKVGSPASSISSNAGAYALVVAELTESLGTDFDGFKENSFVAGIFYVADGGGILLEGAPLTGSGIISGSSVWVKSSDTVNKGFTAVVFSKSGASSRVQFNMNPESPLFIRKNFNVNPTSTNSECVSDVKNYWLGETYEKFLNENLTADAGTVNNLAAAIIPLKAIDDLDPKSFEFGCQYAKSGWIFSQHQESTGSFAQTETEYLSSDSTVNKVDLGTKNLFRFVSISKGEFEQENYKINISNIKGPNSSLEKYGSFDVTVCKINSTDSKLVIVEEFTGCSLDASSENFIGRKIGDKYVEWNYTEERLIEYGEFDNQSSIIRVELAEGIANKVYGEGLLPFGFFGPPRPKKIELKPASTFSSTSYLLSSSYYGRYAGTVNDNGAVIFGYTGSAVQTTHSLVFPKMSTVASVAGAKDDSTSNFFGIAKGINAYVNAPNDMFHVDALRPLGRSEFYVPTGSSFEYSFVFTLDDVSASVNTPAGAASTATWATGSRYAGTSYTAVNGNGVLPTGSNAFLGDTPVVINQFAVALHGGFDGLDVTEREAFKNAAMNGSSTDKNSYVYNSYKVAINTVKDPERVNMNLMAVPGLTNESLTKLVVDNCQTRGDALAIIDLTGDYRPAHENVSGHESVKPTNVRTAVSNLRSRVLNSSYGATYFPWVKMSVPQSSGPTLGVWVPPSVVAVGTLASSEKKSNAVWFAPAGFNRGGLKEPDSRTKFAAGFKVTDTALHLTAKQRDDLYEANINPIANFVNEGIVVFGQKTLQIIPSALDRINVRRLLIFAKKRISLIASGILFDQNVEVTWARFRSAAETFLSGIKSNLGLTDYKVVLDSTTTTDDLIDRNILYAKIYLKPARAIEFIAVDFIITRSGASFTD
jgi:phage tail sheath protein FI